MTVYVLIPSAVQQVVQTSQPTTVQTLAPYASAAVALIAFVGATIRYLQDRRRDRDLRVEEGVAESIDKVIAFPRNPDAGIGSLVAALRNLRSLIVKSTTASDLWREVGEILTPLAREDLDFSDVRHVRFDILCLEYLEGYRSYQAQNSMENLFVLSKYIEELDNLERRIQIAKSIKFDASGRMVIPLATKRSDLDFLVRLSTGYGTRFRLLGPDNAPDAAKRFFKATGKNQSLSAKFLDREE